MDSITQYYELICKTPMLSAEEERDLVLILRNESNSQEVRDAARTKLAHANLRFVFKQARGFAKKEPGSFADLIAAGNEGLLVGIDKFNPDAGVKLLTYAGHWINQRMYNYLSNLRTVSLPIWRQQLATKIRKLKESNENLTADQCVEMLPQAKEADVRELFETQFLSFSLDEMHEANESAFMIDPYATEVDHQIQASQILAIIQKLDTSTATVIIESFGLLDGEDKKVSEVAELLGISHDSVKKLKKQGLEQLKALLSREDLSFD